MKPLLKDPERQKMYEHIVGMFIVSWLLLICLFVFGCDESPATEPNKRDIVDEYNAFLEAAEDTRFICPHCEKHTDFLLKPDPVILERKVGAVVQVTYRLYCVLCDEEIDKELLE